jgi:uncharacterized membrane protein required for colicin V production
MRGENPAVIFGIAWPDLIALAILVIGGARGYLRGFVWELTGMIALVVAIVAAFLYPGTWDATIASWTHLGPGSVRVIAMAAFAAVAYTLVLIVGALLGRVAKLPLVNIINAILGALVGFLKAGVLLWVLVFVALYFPLSQDLRNDMSHSYIVGLLEGPNGQIDSYAKKSLPWFARPFSNGIFSRHHV